MRSIILSLCLCVPAFGTPYWDIPITGVPEIELYNVNDPSNPLPPPPPGPNPEIAVQFTIGVLGDRAQPTDAWIVAIYDPSEFINRMASVFLTADEFRHASGEVLRTHRTIYTQTDAFRDGDVGIRAYGTSPGVSLLTAVNVWHLEGRTPARLYSGDILEPTGFLVPEPSSLLLMLLGLIPRRRWA